MKMKNRCWLILLVVILLAQALPVLAGEHTAATFAELEDSLSRAKSGDVIVLTGDITMHTGLLLNKKKSCSSKRGGLSLYPDPCLRTQGNPADAPRRRRNDTRECSTG